MHSSNDVLSLQPSYHVPALEKGLDILECLAAKGVPLTQTQLARELEKGPSELFRMLTCLERRSYIRRDPVSGAYSLTLRLFELSHTHSPFQELLRVATQPMRKLTEAVRESCHLSVLERGKLVVLAQEESPSRLRLSVEIGGIFPLLHTASGRLLLANLDPQKLQETYQLDEEYETLSETERTALEERLTLIRTRGYEDAESETTEGVHDVAILVGSPTSNVQAALAIASISRRKHEAFLADMLPALRQCAEEIGRTAGITI
ncbi:MAG: IclR family transcriptional regulator [Chloroflexi bacterium]|nr:IclR family transcriptional regulator [Chloroflexota bacterium]